MIFNGIDFSDLAVIEYIRRPLMGARNINSKPLLNQYHSIFSSVERDSPTIEVDLRIIGEDRFEVSDISRTITRHLNVNEPKKLELRDEPGKYNFAIPEGDTENHKFLNTGFVTVRFMCPDPYLYSSNLTLIEDGSGKLTGVNNGTASVQNWQIRIIIINPPVEDLVSITLKDSNQFILLEYEFLVGDVIEVDAEIGLVRLVRSGVEPVNDILTPSFESDFFHIPPGEFEIGVSDSQLIEELTFRERWY